jgi:hypothetical protein
MFGGPPTPMPSNSPPTTHETAAEPDPVDPNAPHERLLAFEADKVGEDAPRYQGQIEKGHGSLFSRLPDEDKAHHAALVALVAAEESVAEARAELATAEANYAEAEKKVEQAAAASDAAVAKKADDDAKAQARAEARAAKQPAKPATPKPAEPAPPAATSAAPQPPA